MGVDNASDSRDVDENASVRHLVELGYVDPLETAAEADARQRAAKTRLKQAIELKRQGRGQEAAALLLKVAADDPEWAPPHQLLAEIHYSSGNWQAAESQLEWLAHHGVDQPHVALIAAGIALARRQLQTAIQELEFARYANPSLTSVHTLLGTVLLRLGKWDEAEDAFREAAAQDPTDARARDGLAAVCLHHGEFEDAADWALRALDQDIRLFTAHYHLGLALMQLNQLAEATAAMETAARVDPGRAAPYFWLSRIARTQTIDPKRSDQYRDRAKEIIRRRRDGRRAKITSA